MMPKREKSTEFDMLQQLFKWADDDISVHDRTGRCCPDYSCCHPELLASKRTRQLFKKNVLMGNNQTIRGMVHFFDVAHVLFNNPDLTIKIDPKHLI